MKVTFLNHTPTPEEVEGRAGRVRMGVCKVGLFESEREDFCTIPDKFKSRIAEEAKLEKAKADKALKKKGKIVKEGVKK